MCVCAACLKGLFKGLAWRVSLITTTFFLVNKFKQTLAPVLFFDKTLQSDED